MKKSTDEIFFIHILLKEKDCLSKLSSFTDLQKLKPETLNLLIELESLILSENEDEYSEYISGGHHRDGLYILEKAKNKTSKAEQFQDTICFSLDYIKDITAIKNVITYDRFGINQLKKNSEHYFTGFKYQARVVDGYSYSQNWLALETTNCSAEEFIDALKKYANSFDIEQEHQCFLGFYSSTIESKNILFLTLDFMDFDFLQNSILSIPQECIFNQKIKKLSKSMF